MYVLLDRTRKNIRIQKQERRRGPLRRHYLLLGLAARHVVLGIAALAVRLDMQNVCGHAGADQRAPAEEVEPYGKPRVHGRCGGLDQGGEQEGEGPAEGECELCVELISV